MRKITLSLLALLVTIVAYCGAPQAFNYQAVALSSNGTPFKLKGISLRLSILDGSSTGTMVYQEKQGATTDNAGLVSVQLGNGVVQSGTFSSIDWSKGIYFLKAELDSTGAGTNYATVGTAQFFSVPYALYADRTSLASPDYPDGVTGISPVRLDGTFSSVVPAGQTMYVTQIAHNNSTSCNTYNLLVGGVSIASGTASTTTSGYGTSTTAVAQSKDALNYPLAIPENQAFSSTSCGTSLVGFTVPKQHAWVMFDLNTGNYTVPAGKVFVLKNMLPSSTAAWNNQYGVVISGSTLTTTYDQHTPSFVDAGQTITASGLSGSLVMMGYLRNK